MKEKLNLKVRQILCITKTIFYFVGVAIGPQITISNSIFKTGDVLEYTCIENSDHQYNRLARVLENGSVARFGE